MKKSMGKQILDEMQYLDRIIQTEEDDLEKAERQLELDRERLERAEAEYAADERHIIQLRTELARHGSRRDKLENQHRDLQFN